MRSEIKKYELNDKITIKKLKKNKFKEGGFMKNIPYPKYYYNRYLSYNIEFHIEISVNPDGTFTFDDFDNIVVLDDNFCQPYYPFYENDIDFPILNKIIMEYNKVMDEFVKKGILKEKNLEKDKDNKKLIK